MYIFLGAYAKVIKPRAATIDPERAEKNVTNTKKCICQIKKFVL